MVFTPRQPLDLGSVGVSSSAPRAVPVDALVALAERVVDGVVIGRLALLLPLLAAGVGAGVLVGSRHLGAALAASTFAVWNPFVVERLAIGHWSLLWAYGALPWLVHRARRVRQGDASSIIVAVPLAAASITPTGGLIAAAVTLAVVVAGPLEDSRRRTVMKIAAIALALQLPWLIGWVVSTASRTSDPAAVAAFAARSEHVGGVPLTALGLGGIWNGDVVPASRGGPLAAVGLVTLAASVVVGWQRLRRLVDPATVGALVACSAAGFVLAVAPSVPGVGGVLAAVVDHVPGAGLLRDAQKWLMPLAVFEALLWGAAVDRLLSDWSQRWWQAIVAAGLALPIILLPDAAATVGPTLTPVRYPAGWTTISRVVRVGGDATVVPFQSYRSLAWAPGRVVLDPASRLLPTRTVVDDRLAVAGKMLAGEDPRARRVGAALLSGPQLARRLAEAGIRWVVVERGTPGIVPDLTGLTTVYQDPQVALYRVTGDVQSPAVAAWRPVAALTAFAIWGLVVFIRLTQVVSESARRLLESRRRRR